MAAKLLHSLADENPDLQKQIGCTTGIFQLFDRHHFISNARIRPKALPSGYPHCKSNSTGKETLHNYKTISDLHQRNIVNHEEEGMAAGSSRTSFSSPSSSKMVPRSTSSHDQIIASETSSRNQGENWISTSPAHSERSVMQFQDSLRTLQQEKISGKKNGPADLRESLKLLARLREAPSSFNEAIQFPRSSFEMKVEKDAPRFSYDGREPNRLSFESQDCRLSVDSRECGILDLFPEGGRNLKERGNRPPNVVAKLMGLESLPDSCKESPARMLKAEDLDKSIRSSNCFGGPNSAPVKKPSLNLKSPIEPAPWRLMGATEEPQKAIHSHVKVPSMYSEMERRLKDIESKQSVKDLKAVKETLEAMQEKGLLKINKEEQAPLKLAKQHVRESCYTTESPIVIMKPAKLVEKSGVHAAKTSNRNSVPVVDKKNNGQSNGMSLASSSMMSQGPGKSSGSLSRRNLQQKKPTKQSKQANESSSKGRKLGHKYPNLELKVDDKSLTWHSSISRKDKAVMASVQKCVSDDRLNLDEATSVTTEHSSPVSVLDTSAYTDDSLSPLKPMRKALRYDEDQNYEDKYEDKEEELVSAANRQKFQNIDNLVRKLKRLNSKHDDERTDYIALLVESNSKDHRYISEILLASGLLLRDLSSGLPTFQPHHPYPVNPELFSVLEHKKASQLPQKELGKQAKFHRKLIFDTVNEILAGKFNDTVEEPWLKKEKLASENLNAQKLLKELCSEIEGLQARREPECEIEDKGGDSLRRILWEDVMIREGKWTDFQDESCALVLEVENLVFKDMVDEIVIGEMCGGRSMRQIRYRPQLCS